MTGRMSRALLLSLALVPGAAAAGDGEKPTLEAWAEDFVGQYAVDGRCGDPAQSWDLQAQGIRSYRLSCSAITGAHRDGSALAVSMSGCRFRNAPAPDLIVHVSPIRAGAVDLVAPAHGIQAVLNRCGG